MTSVDLGKTVRGDPSCDYADHNANHPKQSALNDDHFPELPRGCADHAEDRHFPAFGQENRRKMIRHDAEPQHQQQDKGRRDDEHALGQLIG